ncbi:hypothetical protein GCM10023223_06130 [Stackebrandtia albiflava]
MSRTVFAAIAAATLIGTGLAAADATGGNATDTVAVATAEAREEQTQAGRSDDRTEAEASDDATTETTEEETTATKEAEPAAPAPDWVTPSKAPISDVFGPRAWRAGEMHYGADFAAAPGEKNFAAADGVVVQAGSNGGYGISVIIEHEDGITTVYGHHSQLLVSAGDEVKAGDPIGLAGSTGDVTGPHLHFEVHMANGDAVDPIEFLKDQGVKL